MQGQSVPNSPSGRPAGGPPSAVTARPGAEAAAGVASSGSSTNKRRSARAPDIPPAAPFKTDYDLEHSSNFKQHLETNVSVAEHIALAGARLVLPVGVVEGDRLAVEGSRIAAITSGGTEPGDLDLTGYTVVPGFVDLHVHGGGGASYASGIAEEALRAARTHLEHGTTTTIASTVTGEIDEVARQAAVLSELVEDGVLSPPSATPTPTTPPPSKPSTPAPPSPPTSSTPCPPSPTAPRARSWPCSRTNGSPSS